MRRVRKSRKQSRLFRFTQGIEEQGKERRAGIVSPRETPNPFITTTAHPAALSARLLSRADPVNNAPSTARRLNTCRKQVLQDVQPGQSLVGYGRDKQTRYKYGRCDPVVVEVNVGERRGW